MDFCGVRVKKVVAWGMGLIEDAPVEGADQPIQMVRRLRTLFSDAGVGRSMLKIWWAGGQTKWLT